MKKTFRFLALSLALICGTLSSWAGPRPATSVGPADDTRVGATVSGGVVVYKVVGWDTTLDAYQVEITGLDFDGLATNPTTLDIKTSFAEKYGEYKYKYYVTKISDASSTNKVAFYAMTDLTRLTFAADPDAIAEDKFTFEVGTYAFYGCTKLETLSLPDNVKSIGIYAFQNTAIENFKIPAKCKTIGANAFYNTKKLKTVSVGVAENAVNDQMIVLGKQVFANSNVKVLDLTNAVALQTIDDQAFIYDLSTVNNQLTTITLPKATLPAAAPVTSAFNTLGTCFAHLTGLTAINNLDITTVPAIVPGAFEGDLSLPILNFPKTASINSDGTVSPFKNCAKLEEITFANGWSGIIGDGINNVYATTGLSAADQLKELSYLKKITFKGTVLGTIRKNAFGNATSEEGACSGLSTVEFKDKIQQNTTIEESAFENCTALATLTFAGFEISATTGGNITIGEKAFKNTAIAALDFKTIDIFNANKFEIKEGAFANIAPLATVTFGNATLLDKDAKLFIWDGAFIDNEALTTVTFGNLSNTDATPTGYAGTTIIGWDSASGGTEALVFGDGEHLTTVSFGAEGGYIEGGFAVSPGAFYSKGLTSVTFKDAKAPYDLGTTSGWWIGPRAFAGSKADKFTVTFGTVKDNPATGSTNGQLGLYVGEEAFASDALTSVTFGDFDASSVQFITKAFQSKNLQEVSLGNINPGVAEKQFAIETLAFANTNTEDVLDETIEIGKLNNAKLDIAVDAFKGPQADGSTYDVTIGEEDEDGNLVAGIDKAPTKIVKDAFKAAPVGTATYTIGNIASGLTLSGKIYKEAFAGSQDESGKNNTDVTIGEYNSKFNDDGTAGVFTNVDDVTTATWAVSASTRSFGGLTSLTVEGDVTAALYGDKGTAYNTVEELTIGGSVKGADFINTFGKKVRSIEFSGTNPTAEDIAAGKKEATVVAGAIAESAFEEAAKDAYAANEKVVVIYRVKTAKNSENIFNKFAFTNSTDKVEDIAAVLYTDEWSKANTFENVDIVKDFVYRLTLSAGDVAPGEDIEAQCVVQNGGKYAYGRLFIPAGAGMYYKVSADKVGDKNTVNLFWGQNDGTNSDIYMVQLPIFEGYYWIDATEANQTFVVRTSNIEGAVNSVVTLQAEPADEDDIAMIAADDDYYWFDKNDAKKNALRYATTELVNQELQDFDEFKQKSIYAMLNPKTRGLAFGLVNQYTTERGLAKGSIYVVASKLKPEGAPARLNVIWDDEAEDATAIQKVENKSENADAIYNLQGVRVKNAQKGIFIINGKKYVK